MEKTSKIIESNYQPNTAMAIILCPKVPWLHILEYLQEQWLYHIPGQPIPVLDHSEDIFPNIQSKPPLA